MNSIKKRLTLALVITSAVGFCSSIQAEENFELLNKSTKPITVRMKIGSNQPTSFVIPAGLAGRKNVPNDRSIFLMIQEEGMAGQGIFKQITQTERTKYLTFDPTKRPTVYPQTGTYMGLSSKTSTGLSLKNNVDKDYIFDSNPLQFR
jgi:hypothetical protein